MKRPRGAPRETVAEHLSDALERASPGETLGAIAARLARRRPSEVELLCAVDAGGKPLGVLPVARLFAFDASRTLGDVMRRDVACARLDEDQEHAASLALHHGMGALPVVDEQGRLAGVVPARVLLQVLRAEHVEDLHRLAGIRRGGAKARHAIDDPPLRRFLHRIPWLVAGLAGSA
ncbi:MAG TPA: CBS domain-containing protein, partial [Myxococcota bacterium]|nr:CBS domain-containing protein [Myxococcota bacterium]